MRLKVSEKGNQIWIEVENVCEAYGWNSSKTWQFVLAPFLIPLSIFLVLIINELVLDGIDDIKREMDGKRK